MTMAIYDFIFLHRKCWFGFSQKIGKEGVCLGREQDGFDEDFDYVIYE